MPTRPCPTLRGGIAVFITPEAVLGIELGLVLVLVLVLVLPICGTLGDEVGPTPEAEASEAAASGFSASFLDLSPVPARALAMGVDGRAGVEGAAVGT